MYLWACMHVTIIIKENGGEREEIREGVERWVGRSGRNQWDQWGSEYDWNRLYEFLTGLIKYYLKS